MYCTIYIDTSWSTELKVAGYGAVGYDALKVKFIRGRRLLRTSANPEVVSILDLIEYLKEQDYKYDKYVIFTDSKKAIQKVSNMLALIDVHNSDNKKVYFELRYTQAHKHKDYNWYCDRLAFTMLKGDLDDICYSW